MIRMLLCLSTAFVVLAFPDAQAADPLTESPPVNLIAHRGGVVDDVHIENSLAGLKAAIDRGYWMVEADVRQSKDGQLVVHHDHDFKRFYGDDRKVADLTWGDILKIRSRIGDARPLSFAEFARACREKIRIMVDAKAYTNLDSFCAAMLEALRENDLQDSAMFIGKPEIKERFKGKVRVSTTREALRAAVERGEDVAKLNFLFEHANRLDGPTIEFAESVRVPVVSINTFHYPPATHMDQAHADIGRLKALGVAHFQIDSVYDRWLLD
jgi:glycerophosphoryl diester phosphodiesterase